MSRVDKIKEAVFKSYKKLDPEFQKKSRKKIKVEPKVPYESTESVRFCKLLRKRNVFFIHVPNESSGSRTAAQTWHLKNAGLMPGAADYLIFSNTGDARGIAIEMKRQVGVPVKTSQNQIDFLRKLSECGWRCFVARGCDAAMHILYKLKVFGELSDGKKANDEEKWRTEVSKRCIEEFRALDSEFWYD